MRPTIDSVFELNATKEAYQMLANCHLRGKVIVKVKQ